jgi:hypothetical protein
MDSNVAMKYGLVLTFFVEKKYEKKYSYRRSKLESFGKF